MSLEHESNQVFAEYQKGNKDEAKKFLTKILSESFADPKHNQLQVQQKIDSYDGVENSLIYCYNWCMEKACLCGFNNIIEMLIDNTKGIDLNWSFNLSHAVANNRINIIKTVLDSDLILDKPINRSAEYFPWWKNMAQNNKMKNLIIKLEQKHYDVWTK